MLFFLDKWQLHKVNNDGAFLEEKTVTWNFDDPQGSIHFVMASNTSGLLDSFTPFSMNLFY